MVRVFLRFTSFPQLNQFYYFTSLHVLQDVKNHCARLRDIELKTGRKIPYLRFPHVLLSMQLDWRAWNYKTKKVYLLRIQKKGHKNKHKKTWIKRNDTKWTIWYFQQCACVNVISFASVVTTMHCLKNNQSSKMWSKPWNARARAQLLNMLYNSPRLSVPHGENI